jgi:ABC-type glycerol-3-phosphate transport system permease component
MRSKLTSHAALGALALLSVAPLVLVLNNSLRTTADIYSRPFGLFCVGTDAASGSDWFAPALLNYQRAFAELAPYLFNTAVVCLASSVLTVALSVLLAFVFRMGVFPGKRWLELPFRLALLVPGALLVIPSYLVIKELGLLNSYLALVLPYTVGGMIFGFFLLGSALATFPRELVEAAQMDGAGPWFCLWQIVRPHLVPTCTVLGLMTFLGAWNNFLWPYLVNSDPSLHVISSGLYFLNDTDTAGDLGLLYAAYVLSILPLAVLFFLGTRYFVQGITAGALKE